MSLTRSHLCAAAIALLVWLGVSEPVVPPGPGYAPPRAAGAEPPPPKDGSREPDTPEIRAKRAELQETLVKRLGVVRKEYEENKKVALEKTRVAYGTPSLVSARLAISARLLEAELAVASKPAERTAAYRRHAEDVGEAGKWVEKPAAEDRLGKQGYQYVRS